MVAACISVATYIRRYVLVIVCKSSLQVMCIANMHDLDILYSYVDIAIANNNIILATACY